MWSNIRNEMLEDLFCLISIKVTFYLKLLSILDVYGFPTFITNHHKKLASEFRREMLVEVVLDSQTVIH